MAHSSHSARASATPSAPEPVLQACRNLKYISIVFVYLKLNRPQVSPDSTSILYKRDIGHLWLMDLDGGNQLPEVAS